MTNDLDFFSASAELAACEQLDLPAMELLYRLEISGDDFYQALADRIGNEAAGDLLRKNGREELGHAMARAAGDDHPARRGVRALGRGPHPLRDPRSPRP